MLFTLISVQINGSKYNSVEYTYRTDGLRLSKNVDNNTRGIYYTLKIKLTLIKNFFPMVNKVKIIIVQAYLLLYNVIIYKILIV